MGGVRGWRIDALRSAGGLGKGVSSHPDPYSFGLVLIEMRGGEGRRAHCRVVKEQGFVTGIRITFMLDKALARD